MSNPSMDVPNVTEAVITLHGVWHHKDHDEPITREYPIGFLKNAVWHVALPPSCEYPSAHNAIAGFAEALVHEAQDIHFTD